MDYSPIVTALPNQDTCPSILGTTKSSRKLTNGYSAYSPSAGALQQLSPPLPCCPSSCDRASSAQPVVCSPFHPVTHNRHPHSLVAGPLIVAVAAVARLATDSRDPVAHSNHRSRVDCLCCPHTDSYFRTPTATLRLNPLPAACSSSSSCCRTLACLPHHHHHLHFPFRSRPVVLPRIAAVAAESDVVTAWNSVNVGTVVARPAAAEQMASIVAGRDSANSILVRAPYEWDC